MVSENSDILGSIAERMPLCPENIGQEVLADGVVFVKLAFEDEILRQIVRDAPVAQAVAEILPVGNLHREGVRIDGIFLIGEHEIDIETDSSPSYSLLYSGS